MEKYQLFLSHSSEDAKIVNAFVNFMYKIGLSQDEIIATCSPGTNITIREDIYDFLNKKLSEEETKLYVIYFLSDNYYSSPDCLNEMGAVWLKKSISLNLILPGFDFEDVQGVIGKNKVGIKLGTLEPMVKAGFNGFRDDLKKYFNIDVKDIQWEVARDDFLSEATENSRIFNMAFSRSCCIDDQEDDGCRIIRKQRNNLTAVVNFQKTNSKLCDIVIYNGKRNFVNHYINKRNLCFEAYADEEINHVDVEIRLGDNYNIVNMRQEINLSEVEKTFKIPLSLFCDELSFWKNVSEIKFVLHRRDISEQRTITINNLRLE